MIQIVFETHSTSEDNEAGLATGWLPGRLSATGRDQAEELGRRRRDDGIAAVFSSDLQRAVETVTLAFKGTAIPVFLDWRLRECDYGQLNGTPAADVRGRRREFLDRPHPDGESWRQATARVARILDDLPTRWAGRRVLIVGHQATAWGLEHALRGTALEDLVRAPATWQDGWEYDLA